MAKYNEGIKYDENKLPWHLVPWDSVEEMVKVLQYGARKYEPRNWERGMDWHRPWAATIRHLVAWWQGEDIDPESGMLHLACAMCNIAFLIAYTLRGVGTDTRPGRGMECPKTQSGS